MEKPIVCKSQYIPGFIYDVMKGYVDIVVVVIADDGVVRKCRFERLSPDGGDEFDRRDEVLSPNDNFGDYYNWWYRAGRWYDKMKQFQRVYNVDGEKIVVRCSMQPGKNFSNEAIDACDSAVDCAVSSYRNVTKALPQATAI